MLALRYLSIGAGPELVDLAIPNPRGTQVLLRVTAAGVCHSDSFVMSRPASEYIWGLPLTLGHEGVGVVVEVADAGDSALLGESVAVFGPRGCGVCPQCAAGRENTCLHGPTLGPRSPGLGSDGFMAEYAIVEHARYLVPIGQLAAATAAPLTDAGLTALHAIRPSFSALVDGTHAVVIGAGGVGGMAIQLLRACTSTTVIAVDIGAEKLDGARRNGAHHVVEAGDSAAAQIRELTDGLGASLVADIVAMDSTLRLAADSVAPGGDIAVVGVASGRLTVGWGALPSGASLRFPRWGTIGELREVIALAQARRISPLVETYSLTEGVQVYQRLEAGEITGRAVLIP